MTAVPSRIEISVDAGLMPQVTRELLALAWDPDQVQNSYGESGPVLLVDAVVAEAWFTAVTAEPEPEPTPEPEAEVEPEPEPTPPDPESEVVAIEIIDEATTHEPMELGLVQVPEEPQQPPTPEPLPPVKRGPGRPRKVTTSAPLSEVR